MLVYFALEIQFRSLQIQRAFTVTCFCWLEQLRKNKLPRVWKQIYWIGVFTRFFFPGLVANFEFASFNTKPYGKIPTMKEPIRMLEFTLRLPCHVINVIIAYIKVSFYASF